MISIDFWYNDKFEDITGVDCTFYPNAGEYRGNIYKGVEIIGDYTAKDSAEIETAFPGIFD